MEASSNSTHAPSDPPPASLSMPSPPASPRTSSTAVSDPPLRMQMVVALTLGILTVALPLYFWRRPPAVVEPSLGATAAASQADPPANAAREVPNPLALSSPATASSDVAPLPAPAPPVPAPVGVTLSPVRVLECHDRGAKRTLPDQCDHMAALEQAFAKAVADSATCVPTSAGAGAIDYVVDASFGRKHSPIQVTAPRKGRSYTSSKIASTCAAAVKHALAPTSLDGVAHAHARYKIAITATYPVASTSVVAAPTTAH